jgi:hypothetical protein
MLAEAVLSQISPSLMLDGFCCVLGQKIYYSIYFLFAAED